KQEVRGAQIINTLETFERGFWCWKGAATAALLASVIVLARSRGGLPGWAAMALLSIAALGYHGGLLGGLQTRFIRLEEAWQWFPNTLAVGGTIELVLWRVLPALVVGVAGVATLSDRRRRGAPGWTWVEWAAASLATYLLFSFIATWSYSVLSTTGPV